MCQGWEKRSYQIYLAPLPVAHLSYRQVRINFFVHQEVNNQSSKSVGGFGKYNTILQIAKISKFEKFNTNNLNYLLRKITVSSKLRVLLKNSNGFVW